MGTHSNISADKFPAQGNYHNKLVSVIFNYNTEQRFPGKIVRDDMEAPYETIIQLDDGRVVRAQECQYALVEVV
jgi:hypothetical protein